MADELSADEAASVHFFYEMSEGDKALTLRLMMSFKGDDDTNEQISRAHGLFFADPERHISRAIEFEKAKEKNKKADAAALETEIERRTKANEFNWTWPSHDAPVSDEQASEVENFLGRKFPPDYKSFACIHGGKIPKLPDAAGRLDAYLCVNVDTRCAGKGEEICLASFYGPVEIHKELKAGISGLPKELVPIGCDIGGSYICLDYGESPEYPPVVFWDHEVEETYPISKTFSDFVMTLHPTRRYLEARCGVKKSSP
jgi:hypothetical protein